MITFDNCKESFSNLVKEIIENRNRNRSNYYNIFSVLGIEEKEEITHCRFIYDLLSSNGLHGEGNKYLKLFFENVLDKNYPEDDSVSVYREYWITQESRVDFLIKGKDFCYIIEAKINAGEGKDQLKRYYEWLSNQPCDNKKLYFLTKEQRETETAGEYKEYVKNILFNEEIYNWISECIEITDKENTKNVIEQYKLLLKKITSNGESKMDCKEVELQKKIYESKENYEFVVGLASVLPKAQAEIMKEIFAAVRKNIEDNYSEKFAFINDDSNAEKIEKYYCTASNSHPALNFKIEDVDMPLDGANYVLRIGVDGNEMFIGIAKRDNSGNLVAFKEDEKNKAKKNLSVENLENEGSKEYLCWNWIDGFNFRKLEEKIVDNIQNAAKEINEKIDEWIGKTFINL